MIGPEDLSIANRLNNVKYIIYNRWQNVIKT